MKRQGEISGFFLKKVKQPDELQVDPSPCITTDPQSSSQPAEASQSGQTSQGPCLPAPGQSIYQAACNRLLYQICLILNVGF